MEVSVKKRALAAIFACVTIYGLTLGLIRPLLALILESRGIEKTLIGLNATMPAFGMLLISPLIPGLIKRMGITRFLIVCLLVDILMVLAYPLLDQIYAWFVIGFVAGAATNALLVASEIWINEIAVDASRGRVMAIYNTMLIAAMALGPLIIPLAGIEGWLPFVIAACFVMLASIPLFFTGKAVLRLQGKSSFNLMSFVSIAPVLSFAVLIFAWKEFAGNSLLPVYAIGNGHGQSSAAIMLTVIGLGGLFLTYPFGWLADRMDRYTLLMICGVGICAGTVLLPLLITNGIALWIMLFCWGGLFAGLYTVIMTIIGQRFRGMELAVANVALGIIWGIGSLTGPSLTGVAMDIWDPHGFVIFFISASTAFVIFSIGRWFLVSDRSKLM